MERKEGMKMEDVLGNSSCSQFTVNNFPLQSIFDLSCSEDEKILSLGLMDLLGVQDLISPPFLEIMTAEQQVPSLISSQAPPTPPPSKKIESPEAINQPATPNSSSISPAPSEAFNELVKVDDQEENQKKTKKQLKTKKTNQNQKRQREPRFAFMTKSEVDHLEDGYRWRKYGQKAVKNSPFPRSYYRCTTASCNVKKRVERSFSDPSIVVTTYEGQHTHSSPIMPRPKLGGSHLSTAMSAAAFGMPMQRTSPHYQQPFTNSLSPSNFGHNIGSTNNSFLHEKRIYIPGTGPSLLKDHGLLQDILPSHMLKEE
ncbi:putative WRKY transcription factor 48 [Hibiscus syriacus]|uniref:WRKY transcription factor n=1 Tax=Hibiscus syriacus TaxID=106335 RepID=A0A6A3A012_HIBSY|nr:WRKY transcription factor 23-like [Hibiscus syriacus]KAE8697166.1 putative WRKY transcription factor 48 [Hibiscus syriacus]